MLARTDDPVASPSGLVSLSIWSQRTRCACLAAISWFLQRSLNFGVGVSQLHENVLNSIDVYGLDDGLGGVGVPISIGDVWGSMDLRGLGGGMGAADGP